MIQVPSQKVLGPSEPNRVSVLTVPEKVRKRIPSVVFWYDQLHFNGALGRGGPSAFVPSDGPCRTVSGDSRGPRRVTVTCALDLVVLFFGCSFRLFLVETSATLVVTGALLVVTRSY